MEILKPEDVRADFDAAFLRMAKSMDFLMPDPTVAPYLADFKFFGPFEKAPETSIAMSVSVSLSAVERWRPLSIPISPKQEWNRSLNQLISQLPISGKSWTLKEAQEQRPAM